jgi:hypothetical protein
MEPLSREARREARIVEISLAVFLGSAIVVVASVVLWLVGLAPDVGGPVWATTRQTTFQVSVVIGVAVVVWWLLRARRRGL